MRQVPIPAGHRFLQCSLWGNGFPQRRFHVSCLIMPWRIGIDNAVLFTSSISELAHSRWGRFSRLLLDLTGIFPSMYRSGEGFSAAPFVASSACKFSIAWPYPSMRASLSCLRNSTVTASRHLSSCRPYPGCGHIDIQPLFTGTDTETVNLKHPPINIGKTPVVSHWSNRTHADIQLHAVCHFRRLCFLAPFFCGGFTYI